MEADVEIAMIRSLLPIWESKTEMFLIARGAIRALTGRGSSKDVVA